MVLPSWAHFGRSGPGAGDSAVVQAAALSLLVAVAEAAVWHLFGGSQLVIGPCQRN